MFMHNSKFLEYDCKRRFFKRGRDKMFVSFGIIVAVVGIVAFGSYSQNRKKFNAKNENRELFLLTKDEFVKKQQTLELNFVKDTDSAARNLAQELEDAYPLDYQVNIYNRMVKETKHSPETILELMFEQKRFLLMASILKKVPMFSKAVDEVWHQQLMFTNPYKQFTEKFAGQFIHHAPNVDGIDGADDKFLFDMIYKKLFIEKPFSAKSWGSPFYANMPSEEFIAEWRSTNTDQLEGRYFFDKQETQRLAQGMIRSVKEDIQAADDKGIFEQFLQKQSRISTNSYPTPGTANELTLPYVFWAANSDNSTYAESLGTAKTQRKIKSDSDPENSGFLSNLLDNPKGSKNAAESRDSGSSDSDHSCGSSCGGSD